MKYIIKLSAYPQKGFLPAQENSHWIEESELNTTELLKKIRNNALRGKNE